MKISLELSQLSHRVSRR